MCDELAGHKLICPKCRKRFYICQSCNRGHRYCSRTCSAEARKATFRRSSKLYRNSPGVGDCIAEKQREYRERLRERKSIPVKPASSLKSSPRVTQHTSTASTQDVRKSTAGLVKAPNSSFRGSSQRLDQEQKCQFCSRRIRWFFTSYG